MKFIAVLLIIWWHSELPSDSVDLGARCCEFFFCVSGFLCYYSSINKKNEATWLNSYERTRKRLIQIYPLHLLCYLIRLIVLRPFTKSGLLLSVLNLSLLQAWSNNIAVCTSFNGVTWFLSALLFCTFVTPLFLGLLRKSAKRAAVFLVVTAGIRYGLEFIQNVLQCDYWNFQYHFSPFIRALEFFMGMCTAGIFLYIRKKYAAKLNLAVYSLLEILTIAVTVFLCVKKQGVWLRGQFVIMFCAVCFVFAFDSGIFSGLLSLRWIQFLGKLQLEIYMIHGEILYYCSAHFIKLAIPNVWIRTALCVIIIFACAWIYNQFMKKKAEKVMEKLFKPIDSFVAGT